MKLHGKFLRLSFAAITLCLAAAVAFAQAGVTKRSFGKSAGGEDVDVYTLRNSKGVETQITNCRL